MAHDRKDMGGAGGSKDWLSDADLDALFRDEATHAPLPPSDLMARILADAERVQSEQLAVVPEAVKPSLWRKLLGGLQTAALPTGVGLAGVVGLWIGTSVAEPVVGLDLSGVYDSDFGLSLAHRFPGLTGLFPDG